MRTFSNVLNTAYHGAAGCEGQIPALSFGGISMATRPTSATEEFNGTCWTIGGINRCKT